MISTHHHAFLVYSQEKRISCVDALYHPFLDDGRIRYHTFLCTCCTTGPVGGRQFAQVLEPSAPDLFDFSYEKDLVSIPKAKGTYTYYAPLHVRRVGSCCFQYLITLIIRNGNEAGVLITYLSLHVVALKYF